MSSLKFVVLTLSILIFGCQKETVDPDPKKSDPSDSVNYGIIVIQDSTQKFISNQRVEIYSSIINAWDSSLVDVVLYTDSLGTVKWESFEAQKNYYIRIPNSFQNNKDSLFETGGFDLSNGDDTVQFILKNQYILKRIYYSDTAMAKSLILEFEYRNGKVSKVIESKTGQNILEIMQISSDGKLQKSIGGFISDPINLLNNPNGGTFYRFVNCGFEYYSFFGNQFSWTGGCFGPPITFETDSFEIDIEGNIILQHQDSTVFQYSNSLNPLSLLPPYLNFWLTGLNRLDTGFVDSPLWKNDYCFPLLIGLNNVLTINQMYAGKSVQAVHLLNGKNFPIRSDYSIDYTLGSKSNTWSFYFDYYR